MPCRQPRLHRWASAQGPSQSLLRLLPCPYLVRPGNLVPCWLPRWSVLVFPAKLFGSVAAPDPGISASRHSPIPAPQDFLFPKEAPVATASVLPRPRRDRAVKQAIANLPSGFSDRKPIFDPTRGGTSRCSCHGLRGSAVGQ